MSKLELSEEDKKRKEEIEKRNKELLSRVSKKSRQHINCIRLNIGNSEKHEFGKIITWWLVRNGVHPEKVQEFFSDPKTKEVFHRLTELVRKYWHKHGKIFDYPWERPIVLTECGINTKNED